MGCPATEWTDNLTSPCSQPIVIDRSACNNDQKTSSLSSASGIPATGESATQTGKIATSATKVPSSITKAPDFIRRTDSLGTAGCDIFGPIDLLGSIAVGVNETSSTYTTTVPCIQYVSAHLASLIGQAQGFDLGCPDQEYAVSFGRSPNALHTQMGSCRIYLSVQLVLGAESLDYLLRQILIPTAIRPAF